MHSALRLRQYASSLLIHDIVSSAAMWFERNKTGGVGDYLKKYPTAHAPGARFRASNEKSAPKFFM